MAERLQDGSFYVASKGGGVWVIRDGVVEGPVLDLGAEVSRGTEQGLLGLVLSPDGSRIFLNYTDSSGNTRILEFIFHGERPAPETRREVLAVDQPYGNHNGGNLVFGPDGYLWIGLGDGGSGNDPHDHGQSLATLLGKMLRIDPIGGLPYLVPPENPFVGREGARGEIYMYGLRNPWRYSFDRATSDMWIGDVGQSAMEEIDFVPAGAGAGANFGWARLEGTRPVRGTPPPDAVAPVFTYPLGQGRCAVIGGYVYRGARVPGLSGAYLYGDNCDGRVRALILSEGRVIMDRMLGVTLPALSSFGEDRAGEIYALSLTQGVFRLELAE